jgi:hypothetical protein
MKGASPNTLPSRIAQIRSAAEEAEAEEAVAEEEAVEEAEGTMTCDH